MCINGCKRGKAEKQSTNFNLIYKEHNKSIKILLLPAEATNTAAHYEFTYFAPPAVLTYNSAALG